MAGESDADIDTFSYADPSDPRLKKLFIRIVERITGQPYLKYLYDENRANPARWRGHLDQLLPKQPALSRGNHAALPYADVPAFIEHLKAAPGAATKALIFLILTAARSGEALGARWDEIDEAAAVWTVPAHRMKAAPTATPTLAVAVCNWASAARISGLRLASSEGMPSGTRGGASGMDRERLSSARNAPGG